MGTAKVEAALVVAGITQLRVEPVQDIVLLPGTDFNPGTENEVVAGVTARGVMTFERQEQVGSSIELLNGTFIGRGFDERLGGAFDFTGGDITPMFAVLDNVVQDSNHPGYALGDPASITSGLLTLIVTDYAVRLSSGVVLEVRDPFMFLANFDGLPPSVGTEYLSDPFSGINSQLDVYLAGTDTVVGFTTNRRLTAVPEPSSLVALPLLTGAYVLCRYRKRKLPASSLVQA